MCYSAGVGRTGTFIGLDYLLSQAAAEGQVDIYGLTMSMRKDRVNMIQTVVGGGGWRVNPVSRKDRVNMIQTVVGGGG